MELETKFDTCEGECKEVHDASRDVTFSSPSDVHTMSKSDVNFTSISDKSCTSSPDVSFEFTNSHLSIRNRQSSFSIDSILSHKLLSQQHKSNPATSSENFLINKPTEDKNEAGKIVKTSFEKKYEMEKNNNNNNNEKNNNNNNNTTSRYFSNDHDKPGRDKELRYSSRTIESYNEHLSCSCSNCRSNQRPRYLADYPSTNLIHTSYYSSELQRDGRPYQNRQTSEEDSQSRTLSFHQQSVDDDARYNKRRRTIFTANQLERLEYEFQQQQYIVGQERRFLARELGLNEVQVKVWFQNRRIKWRKYAHGYCGDEQDRLMMHQTEEVH